MAKKWTAKQELEVAAAMRNAEAQAFAFIEHIDVAAPILAERGKRKELTNAAAISRLIRATGLAYKTHKRSKTKSLRTAVRSAMGQMKVAEDLRWQLAMSANYIAVAEARKRSGNEEGQQELAQVGVLGLLDAATRFDPARKLRFTTYARWWVVAKMSRYTKPYPVDVSPNFLEKRMRVNKATARLERSGIDPSLEELAYHSALTIPQLKKVLEHPLLGVSLSTPVYDSPEGREKLLIDDLKDENGVDPSETLHRDRQERWLRDSVGGLNDRQQFVITRRYGLDDGRWRTLSEVGEELGLSRERVRQIESEALLSLRALEPPGLKTNRSLEGDIHFIPSDAEFLVSLQEDQKISSPEIAERLFGEATKLAKQHTNIALRRLENNGLALRTGHGPATRWTRAPITQKAPPGDATWKERIGFDLHQHPWSTSGEIAERLDERSRLNSLSATLGLLCQAGHLQRERKGRTFKYALCGSTVPLE